MRRWNLNFCSRKIKESGGSWKDFLSLGKCSFTFRQQFMVKGCCQCQTRLIRPQIDSNIASNRMILARDVVSFWLDMRKQFHSYQKVDSKAFTSTKSVKAFADKKAFTDKYSALMHPPTKLSSPLSHHPIHNSRAKSHDSVLCVIHGKSFRLFMGLSILLIKTFLGFIVAPAALPTKFVPRRLLFFSFRGLFISFWLKA